MEKYTFAFIVVLVAIGILAASLLGSKKKFLYRKHKSLLTTKELSFFKMFKNMLGNEYHISPKVRIADIVRPEKGLSKKEWSRQFWRTSSKHIDFVICDPITFEIVCCVELNDETHNMPSRKKRDNEVVSILKSAGVPIYWVDWSADRRVLSRSAQKLALSIKESELATS